MTTVTNYQNIFQSKWNQCKNGGQFAGIKFSDTESYRSEFYKAAAAELQKNGKGSAWDVYDVVCDNPSPEYLSQKKQMMKNIEDSSEYFKNNINCSFPDKQSIYTGAKKFIQDKIDLLTEIPDVPSSLYMVVRVVLKKSDAENIAKDVANKTGYTAYVKPSGLLIGYYVYIPDLPIDKASRLVDILYGYTPLCCTNIDFTNQVNCKTGKK